MEASKLLRQVLVTSKALYGNSALGGAQVDLPLFEKLTTLMDRLTPSDFHLDEQRVHRVSQRDWNGNRVFYIPVYSTPQFNAAVFVMPQGTTLPLHDHPNMTVLSKLLFGSVHVQSFDWISREAPSKRSFFARSPRTRPAREVFNSILNAPAPVRVLYPSKGNLHSFTAKTTSAFFDILTPPYNEDDRPCRFYQVPHNISEETSLSEGRVIDLVEVHSDDFVCEEDERMPYFDITEGDLADTSDLDNRHHSTGKRKRDLFDLSPS